MKSAYTYIQPPKWCADAVPSTEGWRHPKTGELLISMPGGIPMQVQESEKPVIKETVQEPVINELVDEKSVIDETVEGEVGLIQETDSQPVTLNEGEPVKKTRARKAA